MLSNQNPPELNKRQSFDPIKSRDLNNSKLDLQGVPNHLSQSHAQLAQESFFKKPHFAENLLKKGFSLDTRGQSADPASADAVRKKKRDTGAVETHVRPAAMVFAGPAS